MNIIITYRFPNKFLCRKKKSISLMSRIIISKMTDQTNIIYNILIKSRIIQIKRRSIIHCHYIKSRFNTIYNSSIHNILFLIRRKITIIIHIKLTTINPIYSLKFQMSRRKYISTKHQKHSNKNQKFSHKISFRKT